jgi:hypothetical protein
MGIGTTSCGIASRRKPNGCTRIARLVEPSETLEVIELPLAA